MKPIPHAAMMPPITRRPSAITKTIQGVSKKKPALTTMGMNASNACSAMTELLWRVAADRTLEAA